MKLLTAFALAVAAIQAALEPARVIEAVATEAVAYGADAESSAVLQ